MRFQARRGNGRFTRNTMENTFGLHVGVHERKASGEWCGSMNPSRVGEPRPTHCHACGEPLSADAVDPYASSTGKPSTREK
jgi:hypothetical protein